ncbi:hypothetical protein PSECIP111951_03065 [Pseudoalteromonas holothuriae]|uniref:Capsule synthesis protein CapA domain-containing protein n=1 Tax=Pseudoalteromonas holothuriae TaxID=2963714 RepID=A0A9W4QZ54_9GAMM|nr:MULTISPECIES: CapA family protein [unclassified Pseudoalteromonas]CAH9059671.1 hypothetical protein PSECIP111854_02453 [Pseudoalteromonas sp. CIP111854]CAH9064170.1 hypothetical protein PSECIP111951_03065 [Pseudoalteromonas sp. CIP111951]
MQKTLPFFLISRSITIAVCLFLSACSVEDAYETGPSEQQQQEQTQQQEQQEKTLTVDITLTETTGTHVTEAQVFVANQVFISNALGNVKINNLPLGNYTVHVVKPGFFTNTSTIRVLPNATTHSIRMTEKSPQQATLIFGGDTMFGRRFMDPSLTTMSNNVPNIDDALIQPQTAASSAVSIAKYLKQLFSSADFASVNLESPILETPTSVHPTKEFAFFSLPDTLAGIQSMGIDYVALGNNHVYDYLEQGLSDTLNYVNSAGLLHSGAGFDNVQAYAPLYTQVNGTSLALVSATSITGEANPIDYIAQETKGGAADLTNNTQLNAALVAAKSNSDYVIAQMHGGDEYSFAPTGYIRNRFEFVARRNIDLAIAHHPHVAQGFAVFENTPAILGLGNLIFDQNRLETLLGLAVSVTIDKTQTPATQFARAYPIYLENYEPQLVTGFLSDYLVRRIAEFSDDNVTIIPRNGYADVYFSNTQITPQIITKTVTVPSGVHVVDLREYAPSNAFISQLHIDESAELTLGRDLMIFGDFEDWDNDEEFGEVARWELSDEDVSTCISGAYQHQQGACLSRTQFDNTPLTLTFRETIRTMPITPADNTLLAYHDFTLFGYAKADNAGDFKAKLSIRTAEDGLEFSNTRTPLINAGSYDWQAFSYHFELPDDNQTLGPENLPARGVNVAFTHSPPETGEATLSLDQIALVSWQKTLNIVDNHWQNNKMHGMDFIKINASKPVTLTMSYSYF